MKIAAFTFLLAWFNIIDSNNKMNDSIPYTEVNLINISQQLLLAAKTKEPTDSFVDILKNISEEKMRNGLASDNLKKTFWINLYNAYTQIILSKGPSRYKKRNSFFGNRQIIIAGIKLSLDDIEHGILRRSKIKWSEGYFNKLFPSKFEKQNRVDTVDSRIHFSLNCGARSCPPIAYYNPENIDRQLNLATTIYLKNETEYKAEENVLYLPAIMGWFRADFGGKKGMKIVLKKLNLFPAAADAKIKFKKYDWNLYLNNYKTEAE